MMKFRRFRSILPPSEFTLPTAIAAMLKKHGIACDLMHGFDSRKWTAGISTKRLALIPAGQVETVKSAPPQTELLCAE